MDAHENNAHFTPAKYPKALSFLGAVGSMLLFFFILALTYMQSDKEPVEGNIATIRENTLKENYAADKRKFNEAKLLDPATGIYKIPVADAIDITAAKLQSSNR